MLVHTLNTLLVILRQIYSNSIWPKNALQVGLVLIQIIHLISGPSMNDYKAILAMKLVNFSVTAQFPMIILSF